VFFCFFILSGCFETNMTETNSVSWYKENDAERKQVLIECNDNPGELEKTPNCINAKQAELLSLSKGKTTRF
jgi:predicted Fe-S protein YdhL (DUF1289 family)